MRLLRDISEGFGAGKMRSGNAAVYQLREQFEKFPSSPHKVEACESIAACFLQLEQYADAGGWYMAAGRLILSEPSASPTVRAISALFEYERALHCYRESDDEERIAECSVLVHELRRECASA